MSDVVVILLPMMLLGWGVAFYLQSKLHKYVSRKKILEIEDVTTLWEGSIPPKEVLNEEGLKLLLYLKIGGGVFAGGVVLIFLIGITDGGLISMIKEALSRYFT